MRHGHTNQTEHVDGCVRKTYDGPDAPTRAKAELAALVSLHGLLPVPTVIATEPGLLTTEYVPGEHGQDLLDAGRGSEVLAACGDLLRRLHGVDAALLGGTRTSGVIRHGDFGPNNILFHPSSMSAVALLDWEFSGVGPAIDDIAWCEWIVRMHHPDAVPLLPAFFSAYGWEPPWDRRQATMIARCHQLEDFCRRWNPAGEGVEMWKVRAAVTASWDE